MTSTRKILGAAAFSVALAGGGVAGAMLGTPGTSGAQDVSQTTATTSAKPAHPGARRAVRAFRQARIAGVQAAAKALGMTPQDLRVELKSGKSIADVANEKHVPVQTVIDAIVAEAKARLETEIGKLPDQVTKIVNHKGLGADAGAGAGTPAPAS